MVTNLVKCSQKCLNPLLLMSLVVFLLIVPAAPHVLPANSTVATNFNSHTKS